MSDPAGGWSAHPDATGDRPDRPSRGAGGDPAAGGRVVGIGAMCDLRSSGADRGRSQGFSVSEFVRLEKGRLVLLHTDRGFTLGSPAGSVRDDVTRDTIVRDTLNVVLPDDDTSGEDHPWSWLAELARARGLAVTAEDLQELPYEVILAEDVTRWLQRS